MRTIVANAAAEALFASPVQPSQQPTAAEVRAAIQEFVRTHGVAAAKAALAQECGDHPDRAVVRMYWCQTAVAAAYANSRVAVAA